MVTNIEIHFLPVDECHTHAPSRNTKHLRLDGQVCFYRWLFCDTVKPQGCISWPVWPLRGIIKTAWGAQLILTADLVYHSSCASLGHLLMAQLCHFCLNGCFSPTTAPHLPPPPTCPLAIDSIRIITDVKKTTSKTWGVQIASRISYKTLAIQLGYLCSKFGVATLHH